MKHRTTRFILGAAFTTALGLALASLPSFVWPNSIRAAEDRDPLPSWNDGKTKRAILKFVAEVTNKGGPKYVPPEERIAAFDNDGALWAEQPMYFQLLFALDRIKVLAPKHPEWKEKEPFASL